MEGLQEMVRKYDLLTLVSMRFVTLRQSLTCEQGHSNTGDSPSDFSAVSILHDNRQTAAGHVIHILSRYQPASSEKY